jgi:hypothetical protein
LRIIVALDSNFGGIGWLLLDNIPINVFFVSNGWLIVVAFKGDCCDDGHGQLFHATIVQ